MDSNSDLIELVVLAGIAIFLIYRLISTLGQRDGFEQPQVTEIYQDPEPNAQNNFESQIVLEDDPSLNDLSAQHAQVIHAIKKMDASFHLSRFMDGALAAYEMIVQAFAQGDLATLKELLDRKIFMEFQAAIKERLAQHQVLDATIVRIVKVWIEEASLKADKAFITVGFTTEQTHTLKNEKGAIIEGDPHQVEEITDIWTFTRSLKSSNPNWTLVETGS